MKSCPTCKGTYPTNATYCPRDGAPLVEASLWSEGTVVRGKYRILAKVGQGGMGAVYKALHLHFGEVRALKVLSAELASDPAFVKRFEQEAIVTRKLQHPNAVRVDDIDESEDGWPFIVMEFIEGRSLRNVIDEEGPLPVPRACAIAMQVAFALDAAHRLRMVHRDIKPDNIVLVETPQGEQAKVLDFGIAKVKEASLSVGMTLTKTGMVVGTPQYMSPEQAIGKRGDELDGRSDIYSLGIVMYEMLTGDLPVKADSPAAFLNAHIQTPPRPIFSVRPDLAIPAPVAELIMRCLEKKRELRPRTAQALIEALDRAEKESQEKLLPTRQAKTPGPTALPQKSEAPPPNRPDPGPVPRSEIVTKTARAASSRAGRLGLASMLLVVAGMGAWYLSRRSRETPPSPVSPIETAPRQPVSQLEAPQEHPTAPPRESHASQPPATRARRGSASHWAGGPPRDEVGRWREAIRLKPDDPALHWAFGVALGRKGDWDGAIKEYREAIRLKPDDYLAHSSLGEAFAKKDDVEGAIAEWGRAIRLKPDDPYCHYNLGLALAHKGDSDGAIAEWREAVRLKPDFVEARCDLGLVLVGAKGDLDGGISQLREAIRMKPDYPEAHSTLGAALTKKGDLDGAIKEYRDAIRLKPDDAMAHAGLGGTLELKGDRQAALEEYRKAYLLNPTLVQYNYDRLLRELNK